MVETSPFEPLLVDLSFAKKMLKPGLRQHPTDSGTLSILAWWLMLFYRRADVSQLSSELPRAGMGSLHTVDGPDAISWGR